MFYGVLALLGYGGAAVLILVAAMVGSVGFMPGVVLAVSITASLLPVLLLCRWAQAYAVDLEMRSYQR